MVLSQHDLQSADLSFQPPLTKGAKSRKIFLSTCTGVLLAGIKYSSKGGVIVPSTLKVTNRPEYGEGAKMLQQPLSDLTREVLRNRIRGHLNDGIPLWPGQRRRQTED